MDMQRLFERLADEYDGEKVVADDIRPAYARLTFYRDDQVFGQVVELFPYSSKDDTGADVPLVRVQPEDQEPVLVSPIPSAIIAVALR